MAILVISLLLLAALGVAGLLLIRKLAGPSTVAECDPNWFQEFDLAKYKPMARLLTEGDYKFVADQPGFTPKTLRKLRAERRRIFRSYLRSLVRDFQRLHMAARMLLIYSPVDRPDLAAALLRQRITFSLAVLAVEFRLGLHALGVGTVDVRALLGALETMRANIGALQSPSPIAA
jgi:hypothetical protein